MRIHECQYRPVTTAATLGDVIVRSRVDRRTLLAWRRLGEHRMEVYVRRGRIVAARYGELLGHEAIYAILAIYAKAPVELLVEAGTAPLQETIMLSWTELLAETSRQAAIGRTPFEGGDIEHTTLMSA